MKINCVRKYLKTFHLLKIVLLLKSCLHLKLAQSKKNRTKFNFKIISDQNTSKKEIVLLEGAFKTNIYEDVPSR